MPIDPVLPLYRSNEEHGYSETPKPCASPTLTFALSRGCDPPSGGRNARNNNNSDDRKAKKKKVSFADHRGLSLTRVKTFSESKDPIETPRSIQALVAPQDRDQEGDQDRLVLDFAQPSSDYLRFRRRLERGHVCLEQCVLKERTLAGTVRVRNLSFEKAVHVRITFDAWHSHCDVACAYVLSTYPDSEHDTFSFEVTLPDAAPAQTADGRIEFAICYEARGAVHWDSNQGENYRVVWSSSRRDLGHQNQYQYQQNQHQERRRSSDLGIHFDRYGSPTCSHGLFPDWRCYAVYENIGPYY
ncbi:unnamed protein product [Merluccius merluccius]